MFSLNNFLFLILTLETIIMLSTFIEVTTANSKATKPPESKHKVTRTECINANNSVFVQNICCIRYDTDNEAALACAQLLGDLPDDEESMFIKLSAIVSCMYTKRNFIKSDTELNMGGINAEAKKLYHNDSVRKNYMINMYRTCGREATKTMHLLTGREKKLAERACQPYFYIVYMCGVEYSKTNCPYFRWKAAKEANSKTCEDYANQCKKKFFKNTNMYLQSLKNIPKA